jgi:hypothetical protein
MKPNAPTENLGPATCAMHHANHITQMTDDAHELAAAAIATRTGLFSRAHALRVADRFAGTEVCEAWSLFGPAVRRAFLNQLVLDDLRIAAGCGTDLATVSAPQILSFWYLLRGVLEERGLLVEEP